MGMFLTKEQELEDRIKRLEKQVEMLSESQNSSTSDEALPIGDVGGSLSIDSRDFIEWQRSNNIERITGTNDYSWGGFIYKREFFLEKFMEARNKAN